MSIITIPIEEDDLQYLTQWTATQGVTVEEFFANEARSLRRHLEAPLHHSIIEATGVIANEIAPKADHLEYLARKHA